MLDGYHKSLDEQLRVLEEILRKNEVLMNILKVLEEFRDVDCYVVAGAINQTVFNYYHGYQMNYGIKDYDIVYFDEDVSYEKEDRIILKLTKLLLGIDCCVDIKNEARVHLWYNERYHVDRAPYMSIGDAIASFGATVTCIGVRFSKGRLEVIAPYGMDDIFGMIIRPVKRDFSKDFYDERALRWMKKWPNLRKIEW